MRQRTKRSRTAHTGKQIWKLKKKNRKKDFHDIVGDSDGRNCGGNYLCAGVTGYDGPTGWGTPNGVGAF